MCFAMTTAIEWTWVTDGKGGRKTGEAWNPIRGCTHAKQPECDECYAEAMAGRFDKPGLWGDGLTVKKPSKRRRWSGKVIPHEPSLSKPLHWRDPRGVFVNSTSDVFHEVLMSTEDGRRYIAAMLGVIAATPQHTYMILSKREMAPWFEWVRESCASGDGRGDTPAEFCRAQAIKLLGPKYRDRLTGYDQRWPLPNLWMGKTTGTQPSADKQIPDLLRTPAAVRFLSCEPLLGPVDLERYMWLTGASTCGPWRDWTGNVRRMPGPRGSGAGGQMMSSRPSGDIDWVITGGESGPKARPSHPDWFRSLRDQCTEAGVAHFFKQWGEWSEIKTDDSWTHMVSKTTGKAYARGDVEAYADDDIPISELGTTLGFVRRVGKKTAGRLLDGREWSEFPDV